MLKTLSLVLSFGFVTPTILAENKYLDRVDRSAKILRELADDSEMLKTLIQKAECVTSLRIHKAGFIFGGKTGTGVTSCRTDDGLWSAASQTRLTGISAGYQVGVSKIEMLVFFMDKDSKYDIIDVSKCLFFFAEEALAIDPSLLFFTGINCDNKLFRDDLRLGRLDVLGSDESHR